MKSKLLVVELEAGERFEIKTSPHRKFLGAEVNLYSNCGGSFRFNVESADAARQLAAALMVSADELEEETRRRQLLEMDTNEERDIV